MTPQERAREQLAELTAIVRGPTWGAVKRSHTGWRVAELLVALIDELAPEIQSQRNESAPVTVETES